MFGLSWPVLIVAAIVAVLSAGRLTRLVVNDHWPPILWAKSKWDARLSESGWWLLPNCPWCFAPWMVLLVGGWAVLAHLHWTWWAFNGWLALSYLASMVVYHDEGKGEDDQPDR